MAILGFTLPPDSGEKLSLGKKKKVTERQNDRNRGRRTQKDRETKIGKDRKINCADYPDGDAWALLPSHFERNFAKILSPILPLVVMMVLQKQITELIMIETFLFSIPRLEEGMPVIDSIARRVLHC